MAISILLTIGIHIGPIRFLEIDPLNAKYNLKRDFVKCILVQIKVIIVKLRRLWLQITTRIMIKIIFKKKIGD